MKRAVKKQLQELISKRNSRKLLAPKNWISITKPEKRISIALDIIRMILIKQIVPTEGSYISVSPNISLGLDDKIEAQPYIQSEILKCEACALGSALFSLVRMENKCTVGALVDDHNGSFDRGYSIGSNRQRLVGIFGHRQLTLIESAFEEEEMISSNPVSINYDELSKAIEFGQQYEYDRDRLIAICLNIIENNGTFKP